MRREFVVTRGGNGFVERQFRARGGVLDGPIVNARLSADGVLGGRSRGGKLVEIPQGNRLLVLLRGFRRHAVDFAHALREPHVVHQTVAAESAFDESSEGQSTGLRVTFERTRRRVLDEFAIDEKPHARRFEDRGDVVPLPVADIHA